MKTNLAILLTFCLLWSINGFGYQCKQNVSTDEVECSGNGDAPAINWDTKDQNRPMETVEIEPEPEQEPLITSEVIAQTGLQLFMGGFK